VKEMERTVACLRKAIFEKEAPLKVAETRLEERTRRVDVELCKDPAMQGSVSAMQLALFYLGDIRLTNPDSDYVVNLN